MSRSCDSYQANSLLRLEPIKAQFGFGHEEGNAGRGKTDMFRGKNLMV